MIACNMSRDPLDWSSGAALLAHPSLGPLLTKDEARRIAEPPSQSHLQSKR
jgi:hypothetical protein